jgi:5-methylcytosine-specific restriction endonuclease McrA
MGKISATKAAYNKRYYKKHRKELIAASMLRKRNPAARKKYNGQRRLAYADPTKRSKHSRYQSHWWASLPESVRKKKTHQKYLRSSQERLQRLRAAGAARRAKAKISDVTPEDIQRILNSQRSKCYYCHIDIRIGATIDHYIPLSRDGVHETSNIVMACDTCNKQKGSKLPDEFEQWRRRCA